MNESLITAFIIVSSIAIVIQAGVLVAMFVAMKKSSARMEGVAKQVEERALPMMAAANSLLSETRPKIDTITDNLVATTTMVRTQVERLDATVTDVVDRTRLQVIRADELVSRTIDQVEETTEMVQHNVLSPIRRATGLVQGLMAGFGAYFGRKLPREAPHVPDDEMFI